jgi:hypothetical protein
MYVAELDEIYIEIIKRDDDFIEDMIEKERP